MRWLSLLAILVFAWPRASIAEDRVVVRGNYYREASTRVLQPMVDVQVDAPDERLSLGAVYLLDAISSASIASGAAQVTGGDAVFTELRHETTAYAASRLGNWGIGGFFRYSTETDYISRSLGISGSRDLLQRSITLSLSYAYNFDRIFRIQNNTSVPAPWCSGNVDINDCSGRGVGRGSNLLQTHYISGGYTHAVLRTLLTILTLEVAHSRGPQDNPYRGALIAAGTMEKHPLTRSRVAMTGGLRYMIPKARMVLEPRYRFTTDSWDVQTHAFDARFHFRVLPHLRLRLRYRYYVQNASFFWAGGVGGTGAASSDACARDEPENCASADAKLDDWQAHSPGLQVAWELDGLAKFRGLRWLEGGWIEATYDHVCRIDRFMYEVPGKRCGDWARMGALAFSLAF